MRYRNTVVTAQALQLETLEKQYDLTLSQLEAAYANYAAAMQTGATRAYQTLPGQTFWGTSQITSSPSIKASAALCQTSCTSASSPVCTGATYNSSNHYCWLSTGAGNPVPGLSTDSALISNATYYASVITSLQSQLVTLNSQIQAGLATLTPTVADQILSSPIPTNLSNNYAALQEEQENINTLIDEYKTVEQKYDDKTVAINYSVVQYRVLVLLVIIIIFVTLKAQIYGGSVLDKTTLIFIVVICCIFILAYIPQNFLALAIITVVGFIIMLFFGFINITLYLAAVIMAALGYSYFNRQF